MEERKPITPEQKLDTICKTVGMTNREMFQLTTQVYINDANFQSRIKQMMQTEYEKKQLQLWSIQVENEQMNQRLLTFKLRRKLQWLGLWTKIKKPFINLFKKREPLSIPPMHVVKNQSDAPPPLPSAGTL